MHFLKKALENLHRHCRKLHLRPKIGLLGQNTIPRYKSNSAATLEVIEDEKEDEEYREIADDYLGSFSVAQRVLVLQPYIKWGHDKRRNTTPELQLAEAVALINTLSNWCVVQKKCVPLLTLQKKQLLGSGALDNLKNEIRSLGKVTAIFVSTNLLRLSQICELQRELKLPIFDRYSIVIHIFRQHAKSPEARLQVALAELPYIRKKIRILNTHCSMKINYTDAQKKFLEQREKKLRNALETLKGHRKMIRTQRVSFGFPSVAVIGYTNAGKTSLIKALTGDASLEPKNKLFATLDTTVHEGVLPSTLKVLYVDTIGFIQDVPETLIEPFLVTLEDAMIADIIVHVYDVSHPDMRAQVQHIRETIAPMIKENKVVIEVANKCDAAKDICVANDVFVVSAHKLTGIDVLRKKMEEELLVATQRMKMRFRVKSGGEESSWLYKETTVLNAEPDETDPQYMLLEVLMTTTVMHKFKRFLKQ